MKSFPASNWTEILRCHALWITFILLALWITGTRWMLRYEPLDRDISAYAVVGRELLEGRRLYSDLWDHKPPGIHLIFAGATALVGPGVSAVYLVNVAFSIAVLGGLMRAGHRLAGKPGAILSGVLWVAVGADLGLQANQPNVELPLNACVAWALAVSLGGWPRRTGVKAIATGGLTAFGLLLKPVAGAPLGLLAVSEAVERWRRDGPAVSIAFLGRWFGAGVCGVAAVMTWAVLNAGFEAVWDALIRYNMAYKQGTLIANLYGLPGIGHHLPTSSVVVIGLLAIAAVSGLVRMETKDRRCVLAVVLGSVLAVAAPGRFYPHYYQLLLPSLVLAAAVGLSKALIKPTARRFAAITMLAFLGSIQVSSLRLPPDEWSRRKYGDVFLDEVRLADYLETHLEPGDFFWQLAAQPGLYLLTETVPSSGVVYDYPLLPRSPVRYRLARRVLADLKESPPTKVLIRRGHLGKVESGFGAWIRHNYHVVEDDCPVNEFRLWTLRMPKPPGSQLAPVPLDPPILSDDFEDGTTGSWSRLPSAAGHRPESL